MKKIITLLLLVIGVSANASSIVTDSVKSEILGKYIRYNIYLPNNFNNSTNKLYPVVYLLHGLGDNNTSWQQRGNMQIVADELIESGEAKEMIIIMPNAGGEPGDKDPWRGYFNMPGFDYEDFFFSEFIPAVESKYRAIGNKNNRAVMGLSMGGGGSVVYCQRHPEMFSSCYAMSPWLDNGKNEVGGQPKPGTRIYYTVKSVTEHAALKFFETANQETLDQMKTIAWYFDCGDDDFLLSQSYEIHMKMRALRIKDQLTVRNGSHNWEYWHTALRIALPFASRNFN